MNPAYRQIKSAVRDEVNSLVKLYSYNIKKFVDAKIQHASSMLAFYDGKKTLEKNFLNKIISLATGMELLSAGLKLHNFNSDDFMFLIKDLKLLSRQENENVEKSKIGRDKKTAHTDPGQNIKREKDYTLELLFGDIFYSRASVYILEYGDHELFDTILHSLKSVHENKLLLHQELVEAIRANSGSINVEKSGAAIREAGLKNIILKNQSVIKNKVINIIEENETLLAGLNSLLKTSFATGWGIFCGFDGVDFPYSIINDFVMFKTFNDLEEFFKNLPEDFKFLKNLSFIHERKKNIRESLAAGIENFRPLTLKNKFHSLYKLYAAGPAVSLSFR